MIDNMMNKFISAIEERKLRIDAFEVEILEKNNHPSDCNDLLIKALHNNILVELMIIKDMVDSAKSMCSDESSFAILDKDASWITKKYSAIKTA